MHSIERYGIVALLFLVVTVVAVLMWDGGKEKGKKKPHAGLTPAASGPAALDPAPAQADGERRLSLVAGGQPGPLQRRARASENALAADPPAVPPAGPIGGGAADLVPTGAERSEAPLYDAPLTLPGQGAEAVRDPARAVPAAASHAYTVQSGDTLSEIAQRELGSSRRWREIVAANPGLDPDRLRLGSKIQIPGAKGGAGTALASAPTAESKKPAPASAQKPAASGKTWKVAAGDSLWRIAEKALGDGKRWREIAALNPKVNPDRLGAGTVLVLPAGASTAAPARTNPPKRAASPTVVASSKAAERGTRTGGRVR